MRYTIENENFVAEMDALGAELRVLRAKADGHDYLWSGDGAVWSGVAPILFPFVGGIKNEEYSYGGQTYHMQKHGFARKSVFAVTAQTIDSLVLTLSDTPETISVFPFPFRLDVCFRLRDTGLTVSHTVTNTGGTDMYFAIGAHPGFACDLGDVLRFEKKENASAYRVNGSVIGRTVPFLANENTWRVEADSFLEDAYVLESLASKSIALERQNRRGLRFGFNAPFLGIWARPGAPYVCLEPWFGVDDEAAHDGELTRKKGIQHLPPSESLALEYTIDV